MRSSNEIRAKIDDLICQAETIQDNADKAGRELTDSEAKQVDQILTKVGSPPANGKPAWGLHQELRLANAREGIDHNIGDQVVPMDAGERPRPKQGSGQAFTDIRTGDRIHALAPSDKWAATCQPRDYDTGYQPSLGRLIVGMATGRWQDAPAEFRAASEGSSSGGGFLVPSHLGARVIDLARSKSVAIRAGAQTIQMASETTRLARVDSDATYETKAENVSFQETDVTFGAVTFTARTIGCLVPASLELIEDAPNAAEIIEQALAKGLAAELDRQFIQGDASQEMLGLTNNGDIGSTAVGGAIAWSHLAEAVENVWNNDHEPNGYVCHPSIASDLATLTSGDGTNSAELWQSPPPSVSPLTQFRTTNCPSANIVLGDFRNLAIGLRKEAKVQVSPVADDAFERYQVRIRVVWRGDVGVLDPSAFHGLTGITT